MDEVSHEVGMGAKTLEGSLSGGSARVGDRNRADGLDRPQRLAPREPGVSAATAAMSRERPKTLGKPEETHATSQQATQDRRRIKELQRGVRRKDLALAETAALLVLSQKLKAALSNNGKGVVK